MSKEYEDFVEKFKPKKTTDDCYTPPEVFEIIENYVFEYYGVRKDLILRPFYPGGDYENFEYKPGFVVVDNPPFSIYTKIVRFYSERKIPFFLFGPHLTLFNPGAICSYIVAGADIVYENGAVVKTSFATSLGSGNLIKTDISLLKTLESLKPQKPALPKFSYPKEVLTVSDLHYIMLRGVDISVEGSQTKHIRRLEHQKGHKKAIFGTGFLMSDTQAEKVEEAKKLADTKKVEADAKKVEADAKARIFWELSEKEKQEVENLNLM